MCLALVIATLAPSTALLAADFSAIWDGGNGTWDDPLHWSTNPNYPDNNNGVSYDATINHGTVTLDRNITIQSLFLSGFSATTLSGAFSLTLNEGATVTNANIESGTINLTTDSTSTLASLGLRGTINNSGTMDQSGQIVGDGTINNLSGATWIMQQGSGMNPPAGMLTPPSAGVFNNAGSLVFTGTGIPVFSAFRTDFHNTGNITLGGTANVSIERGAGNGSFALGPQTQLGFGSFTLESGSVIAGAGITTIGGGTLDIAGDVTINANLVNQGTLSTRAGAKLTLNGSIDQLPSLYTRTGIMRLNDGTIASSQLLSFHNGVLAGWGTINANMKLSDTVALALQLAGTMTGNVRNHYDSFNINGSTTLGGDLAPAFAKNFENSITGSDAFTILTSSGGFSGSFGNAPNGSRVDTADYVGTFAVNYGANSVTLRDFVPSTRWLGGNGNWTDGTKWLSNPLYPNDTDSTHYSVLIRSGDFVALNADITISRFFLTGGFLGGGGGNTLTVTNNFVWIGGGLSGFPAGNVLNLTAGSTSRISTTVYTFLNLGSCTINNGGNLTQNTIIQGPGTINNLAGATWNVMGTSEFIDNLTFSNSGTLNIRRGAVVYFIGNFIQSASSAITRLNGGRLTSSHTSMTFQAGILGGTGTIGTNTFNTSINNNATISPGGTDRGLSASAGTLVIDSNLSLLNNSKLLMEIGGAAQGQEYDYISVDGSGIIGGTLELHVINGFESQMTPSQTFVLLTSHTALTGTFNNVANGARLTTADGLASFQVNYGPGSSYGANNLVLSDPQLVTARR